MSATVTADLPRSLSRARRSTALNVLRSRAVFSYPDRPLTRSQRARLQVAASSRGARVRHQDGAQARGLLQEVRRIASLGVRGGVLSLRRSEGEGAVFQSVRIRVDQTSAAPCSGRCIHDHPPLPPYRSAARISCSKRKVAPAESRARVLRTPVLAGKGPAPLNQQELLARKARPITR